MSLATEGAKSTLDGLDRAFYFIVVLWGERFRDYFLKFCLASALSPGNIPALKTSPRSKFLIATRPDDWAAMRGSDMFALLERYVDPVYIEIPPCPPDRSAYQHMSIGHRMACNMAHQDKAYAVILTPDCMLSEGSVARLQALARGGAKLVLTAALRFGEEPFFAHLRQIGALPNEGQSGPGAPLVISGRQMVYAAVNGFHSETLAYEWDAPGLMAITPAAWWRVPGEDGIVLHSLSWAPLLLDYGAIGDHDTSTFDQWTLDGDYLFNNTKTMNKVHVVQDSDEMFLASWGPLAERATSKTRFPFENFLAGHFFKQSFYSGFFDPLKRQFFFLPVRWHSQSLNEKWSGIERKAMHELLRWVKPPDAARPATAPFLGLQRLLAAVTNLPLSILRSAAYVWIFRHHIKQYCRRMLRGDRDSFARIAWFARAFVLGGGRRT
ncbi:MAG TPA: hypothetical protein VG271_14760 [Beijerinckiaceae bacterium]|jgi:hypothetical protein|nr:hypothetical protein [Beijerinckiaceae bacterium]